MVPSGSLLVLVKVQLRPLQVNVKSAVGAWFADMTVTVGVWFTSVPLMVAEIVLASATDELRLPVAMPLPLVGPGCVSVFPEPVAATTTLAPLTAFPFVSRAITVIVEVPLPAVIVVGEAETVDWVADTGPAVTLNALLVAPVRPLAAAARV